MEQIPLWVIITYGISFVGVFLFGIYGIWLYKRVRKAIKNDGDNPDEYKEVREFPLYVGLVFLLSIIPIVNTLTVIIIFIKYITEE